MLRDGGICVGFGFLRSIRFPPRAAAQPRLVEFSDRVCCLDILSRRCVAGDTRPFADCTTWTPLRVDRRRAAIGRGGSAALQCAQLWQLYLAALRMAGGLASTTMAAISTTLALCFDRQRGLAISLALNSASTAGFVVAAALAALSRRHGLSTAVAETVLELLATQIPLVLLGIGNLSPRTGRAAWSRRLPGQPAAYERTGQILRSWHFCSVALPLDWCSAHKPASSSI
jgi:MFS family permease